MPAICKICLSPYRDELMRAYKGGFPRKMLHEKYKNLIWGKAGVTFLSFVQAIYRHKTHNMPGAVIVQTVNHVGQDVQGIAKMVTELMAKKIETMNPEDISFKDYGTVHRVAMDEKKLQLDKNAQMMAFAAIFGLPQAPDPIKIMDEVEGDKNDGLGPSKDIGDQQKDPQ